MDDFLNSSEALQRQVEQLSINCKYLLNVLDMVAVRLGIEPGTWQQRVEGVRKVVTGQVESAVAKELNALRKEIVDLKQTNTRLKLLVERSKVVVARLEGKGFVETPEADKVLDSSLEQLSEGGTFPS